MKSSKSATLAPRQRLTGCQSDVGTDRALHRNLIRTGSGLSLRRDALQDGLKTAFKAPSLAISPVSSPPASGPTFATGISWDRPGSGVRNIRRQAPQAGVIPWPLALSPQVLPLQVLPLR